MKIQARANCNDYMFTGLVPNEVYEGTPMYDDSKNIYQYDINGIKFHVSHFYPAEVNPMSKWVTSKFNTQSGLGKDQDYKVVEEGRQWYRVVLGDGKILRVGKHIFYSKEECLAEHKVVKEDESGFDNLVYVVPCEEVAIKLNNLSYEQRNFLEGVLEWTVEESPSLSKVSTDLELVYDPFRKVWFYWKHVTAYKKISFNDIFVEETND